MVGSLFVVFQLLRFNFTMHNGECGLSRALRRNPVELRDGRLLNRQPDNRHSSVQDGRAGTPTIVRFAFPIALPSTLRLATSFCTTIGV
jgi:hypothetical protein